MMKNRLFVLLLSAGLLVNVFTFSVQIPVYAEDEEEDWEEDEDDEDWDDEGDEDDEDWEEEDWDEEEWEDEEEMIGYTFHRNGVRYEITDLYTVAYDGVKNRSAQTIQIPASVSVGGYTFRVTSISDEALSGMKKLKTVVIGKNVKVIGKSTFANNPRLTKVTIGTSVSQIGAKAFSGCKKLKNINIQSAKLSKKKVGKNAFKGIHAKAVVTIPKKGKLTEKAMKSIMKKAGAPKGAVVKKKK